MASNVAVEWTPNGTSGPKKKSTERIDGPSSHGHGAGAGEALTGPSIYDSRGVITL
jgi:hypothetical protein